MWDYSQFVFNRVEHYLGVLLQQGRVILDSDSTEARHQASEAKTMALELDGVRHDYRTGKQPKSVVLGDLNGDGRPDLVSANFGTKTVSVLLNRGGGRLWPGTTTQVKAVQPGWQSAT